MEPIRSGTTTERLLRAALLMVVINGFATAFLWDGHFGYARNNAAQLAESLGLVDERPLPIVQELTSSEARRSIHLAESERSFQGVGDTFGDPSLEAGDDVYFLGPGGHIKAHRTEVAIVSAEWVDGPAHTETDLVWQRWIGYVLATVGLVALAQFIRAVGTRVDLTEQGLKIRGKSLVSFQTMCAIQVRRDKGSAVEIEYLDGTRTRHVRLDDYVVRRRDAIVDAICERTGLTNPLRAQPAN